MIERPLNEVTAQDIETLLRAEVPEGRTLDYKEQLDITTGDEKKEFLRDISSFANAQGGDIIFGIKERRENGKPTGIPEAICGLQNTNFDSLKLQLEQIIRSGIDPKLPSVTMREIACPSGTVFVIRVGDSWTKPHRVSLGSSQFYVRGNAGKQTLDSLELRDAFLQSFELEKKVRDFRDNRLATILSNDLLLQLSGKSALVMHFVPLDTFRGNRTIDLTPYRSQRRPTPKSSGINGYVRPNMDGLLFVSLGTPNTTQAYGYTQLFHSGAVEMIDGDAIHEVGESAGTISGYYVEQAMVKGFKEAFDYLKSNQDEFEMDVISLVSMLNVRGYKLHQGHNGPIYGMPFTVDRNHLLFNAMRMQLSAGFEPYLKAICDQFWQAFGASGSPNFDANGKWAP